MAVALPCGSSKSSIRFCKMTSCSICTERFLVLDLRNSPSTPHALIFSPDGSFYSRVRREPVQQARRHRPIHITRGSSRHASVGSAFPFRQNHHVISRRLDQFTLRRVCRWWCCGCRRYPRKPALLAITIPSAEPGPNSLRTREIVKKFARSRVSFLK